MNNTNDFDMFEHDEDSYNEQSQSGYPFEKFKTDYPNYLDSLNSYQVLIYNTYILVHNKRFLKIKKYPDCLEVAQKCGLGMLMRHALETISTSIATENGIEVGARSVFDRLNAIKGQNITGYDDEKKKILFKLLDLTNEISHPHVLHANGPTFDQLQNFYKTQFSRILNYHITYIADLIQNSRSRDFGITKEIMKSRKQTHKYLLIIQKSIENFNIFSKETNILIQGCLVRQLTECTANLWAYNYEIVPTDVSSMENQISLSKILSSLANICKYGKKTAFGTSALTQQVVNSLYAIKDASNSLMHVEKFAASDLSKMGKYLSDLYKTIKIECSPHVMKTKLNGAENIGKAPRKKVREKSPTIATLLCGVLGWLGAHYFYMGRIFKGILYILFGGFIIGPTLDLCTILKGRFRNKRGFRMRNTQLSAALALILLIAHLMLWYSIGILLYNNGTFDKIKNFDIEKLFTLQQCDETELANMDRVGIAACSATSYLTTAENSYDPVLCIDSNPYTCWQEGAAMNGEGESLTFYFPQEETVSAIAFLNGKHTDQNAYYANSRAERVIVQAGYMRYIVNLEDLMQRQTFVFKSPKKVSEITVIIDSAYPGGSWEDLCISEVEFYKER